MASVLIIESNKELAVVMEQQLRAQGFDVIVTHRGDDGMNHALNARPDLILMDATMPDATGFQMCKRFRQNEATCSIPIVLMSALAQYANQQAFARERGANEFISKPVEVIQLGEVVDRYIGTKPAEPHFPISNDVQRALSNWLGNALTRNEQNKNNLSK